MILICPNCSTRYLLSSAAIGAEGRDVRCAKCAHEWYEMPEPALPDNPSDMLDENMFREETGDKGDETPAPDVFDPAEEDDSDDEAPLFGQGHASAEEAIPDAVKPLPEGSNVPAFAAHVVRQKPTFMARVTGVVAALILFAGLIGGGVVFKQKIVSLWPPAAFVYEMAGMPVQLKGEGLVIETLSAGVLKDEEGRDVLVLKGRVVNLTGTPIDVPPMLAILRSTNGEDGDSWVINPPVDKIEPGASYAFSSDYPAVPRGTGSVNLTFIPTLSDVEVSALGVLKTAE